MIVFAFDRTDRIIGIVNASSVELAKAYWQGKELQYDKVRHQNDLPELEDHPTGVYPIMETYSKPAYTFRDHKGNVDLIDISKWVS